MSDIAIAGIARADAPPASPADFIALLKPRAMSLACFTGAVGGLFIRGALTLWREQSDRAARRLFAFSILNLFLILALLVTDRLAEPLVLRLAAARGF